MPHSLQELNFNNSSNRVMSRVRELSKTSYWQTIYSTSKELGMKIFHNNYDFSELQILFLNYLGFYHAINMDIALGDVTNIVLENEIYEDSYIFYKNKIDKKKVSERQKPQAKSVETDNKPKVSWVFKKPKKA